MRINKLFGRGREDGEALIYSHTYNENERIDGTHGPIWRHGRWWLYLNGYKKELNSYPVTFRIEWCLFNKRERGFSLCFDFHDDFGMETDLAFHLCLPFLGSLFFSVSDIFPNKLRKLLPKNKRLGLEIYEEYIWISLWWSDPAETWGENHNRFKWQRISIDWKSILFGELQYLKEELGDWQEIEIPMPEATYKANIRMEKQTWWRSRWPGRKIRVYYNIRIPEGIPTPGKGENSWDCGDDAIMGLGSEPTIPDAIATVVKAVMERRERYGGRVNWKPRQHA